MANIERLYMIDSNDLSSEHYFTSLLQEAHARGLLIDSEIENIQLQCIKLLAYKSERYNDGKSSSIRVEAAESIMQSILYTIGLYLKSLSDTDYAVSKLKAACFSEMYEKGRKLINIKLNTSRHIYRLVQKNKISTLNYTYNATIDDNGIGSFFELYDPDYEAHETSASIDYQLCNPVTDLAGVEYIQKYLENLYIENEFCGSFASEDIHHLLSGYDEGYKDLLINIFEHVLTSAFGCVLARRRVVDLNISEEDIKGLYNELSRDNDHTIALKIHNAAEGVIKELNINNSSLIRYIEKSLSQITTYTIHAVRTNTLGKIFVSPVDPDLKPKIQFSSSTKMDDKEYREFIDELVTCRYSSDKVTFIKKRVKSFGDIEDVLLDAQLTEEETASVLNSIGNIEIAELVRRHPFESDIQAENLSETELILRSYLKNYIDKLVPDRQTQIFETANQIVED